MSLKYLNLTGLSTLVTDIKNWVTARIPTKTSEITNDSGYITGTSDCVHKTGNEFIEGEKTFASPIQCPYFELIHTVPYIDFHFNYSSADFTSRIAEYTSGELWINGTFFNIDGSVRHTGLVQGVGRKEYTSPANLNDGIYNIESTYWGPNSTNKPSSSYGVLLSLNREGNIHTSTGNGWLSQLAIGTDNRLYTRTKPNTTGTWTAWKEYLNSSDYVTLNTQQNISADKFFYGGAWRVGSNWPSFICKNDTHTVGEAASSSMWGYGEFLVQDKNGYSVGLLSCRYDQNATQYFRIESRNKFTNGAPAVNGTAASSVLDVGTISDGTPYVYWNSYVSNALVPRLAFTWDIGSYANPWNIVCAANYKIKSASTVLGVTSSNSTVDFIELIDANNAQTGYIGRWQHNNGYSCITLTCSDKYDGAGNRSTSGTVATALLEIGTTNTGVPYLNYNTYFMQNVTPLTSDNNDLGDTYHHWRNLLIGEIHCYHNNAVMMKSGSYTFLLRNDGSSIWFLISDANGNEGTWSGLRPLYINCATGACTSSSKWTFDKSFGDSDPSVLIQSGTAYANGTWNYPLSALAPNMQAGANLFMPIGRSHSTGNCAGWHWYYAGDNSNDNHLSVEFYAVGSHFAVYRDGRVYLSTTPDTSDNSTRVATTAFVKANAYTHPTSAGNKHIPSGGSSGQILKYSSSGTAVWADTSFARAFSTIHSESGTGYAYAKTSWTPKEVSLTLTTQQPAFISIDITTSGTMLFKGTVSNCFIIAVHNAVGSQSNKQDSTTYGALFTQTSSGRNRVQVLVWPYSSSVKISIAYVSGSSNINNGNGLDSFSMGVYQ